MDIIGFLLAVTKPETRKQHLLDALKIPKGRRRRKQEETASLAKAKEISVGAAVAAALSKPDGMLTQGTEDFSWWTTCFHFTPDWPW